MKGAAAPGPIEHLKEYRPGDRVLIPLTSSLYVTGEFGDTSQCIVDVGPGPQGGGGAEIQRNMYMSPPQAGGEATGGWAPRFTGMWIDIFLSWVLKAVSISRSPSARRGRGTTSNRASGRQRTSWTVTAAAPEGEEGGGAAMLEINCKHFLN